LLTPEEVRHVAMLARLGLTDTEVETMRAQLAQLLDYIAMLNEVDTSSVEPTAQVRAQSNVTRDDVARPSLDIEEALRNAPRKEEQFFRVPAVMEETTAGPALQAREGASNG
jgi:aspartyl-tRNA(Asn)/glutamyl-tRNA(Gln) amidotransferase subunit C